MVGLIFPGQGSQKPGMAQELYNEIKEAKDIMERAVSIADFDLKKLMFEGSMQELTQTEIAQPAIYTASAMYFEKFKQMGKSFDYVAGHSLGEYSALYAAGVYSFEDGLKLVIKRGRAMSEAKVKGSMAAVIGLTEAELLPLLQAGEGEVVAANLNTENQIVISGTAEGIEKVKEEIIRTGIKAKVIPLNVSGPFHSPYMSEPKKVMDIEIENMHFTEPIAEVIPNVSGKPTRDVAEIKAALQQQIVGQVRWYDTIMTMKEQGVTEIYEVGYGNVLQKMNRTITEEPKCLPV